MNLDQQIDQFLAAKAFGVAGASTNRQKFGNKVLRCYLQHGRTAIPVNPRADVIEDVPCVASVAELPDSVGSLSIITPPAITVEVVKAAHARGIRNVWMQPGAAHPDAVAFCAAKAMNCIHGGPCILVQLGYRETP